MKLEHIKFIPSEKVRAKQNYFMDLLAVLRYISRVDGKNTVATDPRRCVIRIRGLFGALTTGLEREDPLSGDQKSR